MSFIAAGDRNCTVPIVCEEPGECIDIVVGAMEVSDVDNCIQACRDNLNCRFWTLDPDQGYCVLFSGCKDVDNSTCPSCIYGEADCPIYNTGW